MAGLRRGDRPRTRCAIAVLVIAVVVFAQAAGCFWRLEWLAYDLACGIGGGPTKARGSDSAAHCVLVAVDEESLSELGKWPWPRSRLAQCLERLRESGAAAVGLDIILSEPDRSDSGVGDDLLAAAVARAGNVVCAVASESVRGDRTLGGLAGTGHALRTIEPVRKAARAEGHVVAVPGAGGVLRSLPAFLWLEGAAGGARVRAMSLELAAAVRREAGSPPTDRLGFFWPRFSRWPEQAPPTYSFSDVVAGRVDPSAFRGKAVVVGVTAQGLHDHYFTPCSRPGATVPGAVIHADAVECLVSGSLTRPAPSWCSPAMLAVASVVAAVSLLGPGGPAGPAVAIGACAAGGAAWAWVFAEEALWLPGIAAPLLLCFVAGVASAALWALDSERRRRAARRLLGSYVGGEVLGAVDDGGNAPLRRSAVAVTLFADIRGYSAAAGSRSPADTAALLDVYLSAMSDTVRRYGGEVYKFAGDGVLALFELPAAACGPVKVRPSPMPETRPWAGSAAERALRAALDLTRVGERLRSTGLPVLATAVGLGVGPVAVGSVGLGARRDFTAVGEAVNVAFELESVAGQGGVVVAEQVVDLLPDGHHLRRVLRDKGAVRLKGSSREIRVFELDTASGGA